MKLNNKVKVEVFYYPECEYYKCELHIGVNGNSNGGYAVTDLDRNLTVNELAEHIKKALIQELGGNNEIQE